MELRQLRYFIAAGEEQNFNRAADRLHVAQPALSRQIRALEDELGFLLFQRNKRGVVLTAAGIAFLKDAQAIVAELLAARRRAEEIDRGHKQIVTIGVNLPGAATKVVTEAVRQFKLLRPSIVLELAPMPSSRQMEKMLTGTLQGGFLDQYLFNITGSAKLGHLPICDYSLVLGMRPDNPLASQPTIRLADLTRQDFIWTGRGPYGYLHDFLLRRCREAGLDPRIAHESQDQDIMLGLIHAGAGIGFVHSTLYERPYPGIVLREIEDFSISFPLCFAWNERLSPQIIGEFREVLSGCLGNHDSHSSFASPGIAAAAPDIAVP